MIKPQKYEGPNGVTVESIPKENGTFTYQIEGANGSTSTDSAAEAALALC